MSTICQSSKSIPTLSKAHAPNVAKLANAITANAFRIKCIFKGLLSLCEGILREYNKVVIVIL